MAAYGVIVVGGRVLLVHWNEKGHSGWTLPGGGLDPGEDPADAACREIFEETGYVAQLHGLLGIDSIVFPAEERIVGTGPLHAVRIVYRASITGGELRNELGGSTDEAAWFDLADVELLPRVELVNIGLGFAAETATAL